MNGAANVPHSGWVDMLRLAVGWWNLEGLRAVRVSWRGRMGCRAGLDFGLTVWLIWDGVGWV